MIAAALGLIFTGATIGIHVDELKGVTLETSVQVTRAIARSIEAHTPYSARIDDPDWPMCSGEESCIASVRARLQADGVLIVRLLGSPTLLRVVATLHGLG